MDGKTKFPVTFWVISGLFLGLFAAIFTELGNALTRALTVWGVCHEGDNDCLIIVYGISVLAAIIISFVVDQIRNSRLAESGKTSTLEFGDASIEEWDMRRIKFEEAPEGVISTTTTSAVVINRELTTSSPVKSVYHLGGKSEVKHLGKYSIAFVDISVMGAEEAKGVTAKPEFYSTQGKRKDSGRIYARWWEKAEQAPDEDWRALRTIDIQRGNAALLAFAFKPPNEEAMYAYDHAAHSKNTQELKRKGTNLGFDPILTRISIESRNGIGPYQQWFRLRLDQNKNLIVKKVKAPRWTNNETN